MKVVRGKLAHLSGILDLLHKFWDESDYSKLGLAFDSPRLVSMVKAVLDGGIAQVAVDEGKVVGVILVIVFPSPFHSDLVCATELIYFVDPAARGAGIGKLLVAAAENVAKQLGVRLFNMVHLDSTNPERAEAIYKKAGYRKAETAFVKDLG